MAALDDLEKGVRTGHWASPRSGGSSPQLSSFAPTKEADTFNSDAEEQDTAESIRHTSPSDAKGAAPTDSNAIAKATGTAYDADAIDFPDGGLRAWSVVFAVSNDPRSVTPQSSLVSRSSHPLIFSPPRSLVCWPSRRRCSILALPPFRVLSRLTLLSFGYANSWVSNRTLSRALIRD
jgi:hypothetical protein